MEAFGSEDTYTPAELAKALKVTTRTIRNWIAAGDLAALNIGSAARPVVRITPAAITAFITARGVANGSIAPAAGAENAEAAS